VAFTATQVSQILYYCEIPNAWLPYVAQRCNWLSASNPTLEAIVQNTLADLVTLDSQVATQASKDGLKKADVLEWFGPGGNSAGFRRRYQEQIGRIFSALDLKYIQATGAFGGGGGQAGVDRS
jgi:hypothetical protein